MQNASVRCYNYVKTDVEMMSIKARLIDLYVSIVASCGVEVVHFIHVGKTAGTAIKASFSKKAVLSGNMLLANRMLFVMHGHSFKFSDLKKGESAFFVVRDPVKRFVSGFYSRQRMGRPLNFNPWSEQEKIAFSQFHTANELALALGSADERIKADAEFAMKGIGHVKSSYWDWFGDEKYLHTNRSSIKAVLVQESLNDDFKKFRDSLRIPIEELPADDVASHKNPDSVKTDLSPEAVANIRKWYSKDYRFLQCLSQMGLIPNRYNP